MAKYLYKGKWITEKQYLAIPDQEYQREEKRRKKIKIRTQ